MLHISFFFYTNTPSIKEGITQTELVKQQLVDNIHDKLRLFRLKLKESTQHDEILILIGII